MSVDLTFKDVCTFIKEEDHRFVDALDKLLALPLLFSPLFMEGFALLPLIAAKNELTKLSRGVFEAFTKKKSSDYMAWQQRMKIAYGLISFTSFFEAIDRQLPVDVRERLALATRERVLITKDALRKTGQHPDPETDRFSLMPIAFPHPVESFEDQQKRLRFLYVEMTHGFRDFISKLSLWEKSEEKTQATITAAIDKLPKVAIMIFEAQYFELARKFEDFAIWANLHEHKNAKQLLDSLSGYVKSYIHLATNSQNAIDVGLGKLHDTVVKIPEILKLAQATELVDGLKRHYAARIDEPIIEDKEEIEDSKPRLSFPRVREAFIPQSYLLLRHSSKGMALEDEETWRRLSRRDDIGTVLLANRKERERFELGRRGGSVWLRAKHGWIRS
jgi:hypothetical protein